MKLDGTSCCGSLPCRHGPCASQDVQQLIMPVSFTVLTAAILRLVASSVRCHPDLQKPGALILLIHLLWSNMLTRPICNMPFSKVEQQTVQRWLYCRTLELYKLQTAMGPMCSIIMAILICLAYSVGAINGMSSKVAPILCHTY